MTHERSLTELRTDIDSRLETAFDAADQGYLEAVLTPPIEREDRWFGQLTVLSHDAVTDGSDSVGVLPAATAVELLREYVYLRNELLVRVDDVGQSPDDKPTAALLAGDYLYSSAFQTLGAVDDDRSEDCFEALTEASRSIIEAFGNARTPDSSSPVDVAGHLDDVEGALGRAAAVIGATIADVDAANRGQFATFGKHSATVRRIGRVRRTEGELPGTGPPEPEGEPLRRHADRHASSAVSALDGLSTSVDTDTLRQFVPDPP